MRMGTAMLAAMAVMTLAWWAYQENYRTRAAIAERAAVRAEIADLRRTLTLLDREWAYLNRPERLQELALINYAVLGLDPMTPAAFGALGDVPTPEELVPEPSEDEPVLAGAEEEFP